MAKLPTVAIIGRPNAGKSTLFNRLVGRRKAIVSDIPGTTRDHIAHRIEGERVDYLLLDTGGMGGGTEDADFEDDVEQQSKLALSFADLILFLVNGQEELTSADFAIAEILRKERRSHVPIIVVASKMDDPSMMDEAVPKLYELGISDQILGVSAPHKIGTDELKDAIEEKLSTLHFKKTTENEESDSPRIAIIGKPNVGKSSIVNAFLNEREKEKSPILVSEVAGTTRDSIDTEIKYKGKKYVFTDTAGLKRRKDVRDEIEHFAMLRTIQSLERSDIAVLVVDAKEPVSRQDKRVAGMAIEHGKGILFLMNKIDLLTSEEKKKAMEDLRYQFPFCSYAPVIPCSATTREGLLRIFDAIAVVAENRVRRIPTGELNKWFERTTHSSNIRVLQKGTYLTQPESNPPTFVLFVSDPKKVALSDLRFLENRIRESYDFTGTPIRWVTKGKNEG